MKRCRLFLGIAGLFVIVGSFTGCASRRFEVMPAIVDAGNLRTTWVKDQILWFRSSQWSEKENRGAAWGLGFYQPGSVPIPVQWFGYPVDGSYVFALSIPLGESAVSEIEAINFASDESWKVTINPPERWGWAPKTEAYIVVKDNWTKQNCGWENYKACDTQRATSSYVRLLNQGFQAVNLRVMEYLH